MAEKTSITVSSINGNTKTTKSITDINPNATDAELITLTNALYAMTTNDVSSASKVTKRDIIADNVYPLVLSTSIINPSATDVLTKVDDTHYILNLTAFGAQQLPAGIEVDATVNGQAMRPSTITYSTPIAEGTEAKYGLTFASGGYDGASTIEIGFMKDSDFDADIVVTGDYLITLEAGTFGDYNYGSATITITVTEGA